MAALTRALARATRSPSFALLLASAALAVATLVVGVGAPVPAPPTALLVIAAVVFGLWVADETLHAGVLVGLGAVAADQVGLGASAEATILLVLLPWVAFRASCRWAAGPMRRFHGWLPARPTLTQWAWPAWWLVLATTASALLASRSGAPALVGLAGSAVVCGGLAVLTVRASRPASLIDGVRAAVPLLFAEAATASLVAAPAAEGPPWVRWAALAAGSLVGLAAGLGTSRLEAVRRLGTRLRLPASGVGVALWVLPGAVAAGGTAYALLGGEGGAPGRVVGLGVLALLLGASLAGVPILWGAEYGVADWVRRRQRRPDPVAGLDLLRVELRGRPVPRPGRPPFRLLATDLDGRALTVELRGAVCLNDRSYVRQEPVTWLCPLWATLEVSGRLDRDARTLLVDEADGAWLRALPAPRDPALSRRGVAVGLRIAVGLLLAFVAVDVVAPRLEDRYAPACRRLFRDPVTLRAPLVTPDRCAELLADLRRGH